MYRYLPQPGRQWKMVDNEAVSRTIGPFARADLEQQCPGISLPTIKRELAAMWDEGLVLLDGRGRGARWRRES